MHARPLPALVAAVLLGAPACARDAEARVAEVKAVFILNFTRFVAWPPAAFPGPEAPFLIGVLGDDPFGATLDEAVAGERLNGRRYAVVRARNVDDLAGCQLVYVAASATRRLPEVLRRLRDASVLTVGETSRFTRQGGAIGFFTESDRLRFEINAAAAAGAGLKVSAPLLKLARRAP